jgi:tRNA nucleotidyltransferase (CCA-adding enzyme)
MAWTTEGAFGDFHGEINLPGDHHGIANVRRDWVLQRLRNNGMSVLEAVPFGSILRFTALKEHADVDVLAALRQPHQRSQALRVLLNVKNTLGAGQAGKGRRNGQP